MTWLWQKTSTPLDAVNLGAATGDVAIYYFKEALKQAGGLVKSSGDSLSYFASSDGITHSGSGAGGMGNAGAWFRYQSPAGAGGREYTFQRSTANNWRHKYSFAAGFTGGSPSATQTPSATDERIVLGAGTDASPSYAAGFNANASKVHIGVNNAAPYPAFMFFVNNGYTTPTSWILWDGLETTLSPVEDVDQWVTQWYVGTPSSANLISTFVGMGWCHYKKGLSGEAFARFVSAFGCANLPVNPYNGNDEGAPILLWRTVADGSGGWKGWCKTFRLRMTASRQIPDYVDVGATRWAVMDGLLVPYPPTVEPST